MEMKENMVTLFAPKFMNIMIVTAANLTYSYCHIIIIIIIF
jgi:hypothetical protein